GVGVVALDVPGDVGGGTLVGLLEGHSAGDLGVTTENSNCGESKGSVIVSIGHRESIRETVRIPENGEAIELRNEPTAGWRNPKPTAANNGEGSARDANRVEQRAR